MNQKTAYLTYDDGPSEPFTSQILDLLDKENIKATFFVCGMNAKRYPELVKEIVKRGHSIGNHSYSHSKYNAFLGLWSELGKTNRVIKDIVGFEPRLYRAPYGYFMPWILPYTLVKRMKLVGWNVRGKDWEEFDPAKVASNILSSEKDSLTILLHDGNNTKEKVERGHTVEATKLIIKGLKDRGYVFKSF